MRKQERRASYSVKKALFNNVEQHSYVENSKKVQRKKKLRRIRVYESELH